MTLYAHDGLEMIMMERFEGLTSAVDCHGDDGTMSLTFSSADAYKAALQEWAHINDSDEGKFLLIANHDGCGPNDRRQPYMYALQSFKLRKLLTVEQYYESHRRRAELHHLLDGPNGAIF